MEVAVVAFVALAAGLSLVVAERSMALVAAVMARGSKS
jgi:hypothetical protein